MPLYIARIAQFSRNRTMRKHNAMRHNFASTKEHDGVVNRRIQVAENRQLTL